MKLCGFSSIFDVDGRMDRKEALERLRDNMEWLSKWYHLHKVSYEQTKRENEVPSNNWTNMKILQYINSALRKEYGLTVVTDKIKRTRNINWLKINYTAISPLLFDFDACETLDVDPRDM